MGFTGSVRKSRIQDTVENLQSGIEVREVNPGRLGICVYMRACNFIPGGNQVTQEQTQYTHQAIFSKC